MTQHRGVWPRYPALFVATAALLAACGGGVDDCLCERAPALTVRPTALTLAVGDTASVEASATLDGRAVGLQARWESAQPTAA